MVDANIPQGVDTFGKAVSELQSDVAVGKTNITGTLKYVTGYTGFSGKVEEQSGNYLALHVDSNVDGATLTVELLNGTVGHPVTLDNDKTIILRIANKNTQKVRVVAKKSGYATITKTFDLSHMVVETA